MLLFGGFDATSTPAGGTRETWAWNGSDWNQLHPAHSPSLSESPFLALDDNTGQILLIGVWGSGATGPAPAETWMWIGTDWIDLPNPGMPRNGQLQMAFDPQARKLIMSGAGAVQTAGGAPSVWLWDGAQWQMSPSAGPIGLDSLATDYKNNRVLGVSFLFGTWTMGPAGWTQLRGENSPPSSPSTAGGNFAWDPLLSEVVEYGATHDGRNATSEVFGWDGFDWVVITA